MEFDRTGIILYTLDYKACVHFYSEILGLKTLFKAESLTCFEFGACYLMVELDDEINGKAEGPQRTKTCLRMNVANVKELANKLTQQNIAVDYQEHSWGTVAKFFDPEGNLLAFKDSLLFEKQINEANY